MEASTSVNVLL